MRSRADTKGVLVTKVEPGSDAQQQAGTAGDLVLQTRTMCRALKNSGARSTGCAAKAGGSAFLRLSKIQPVAVNQFPGAKWIAGRRLASVDRPRYVAEKSGAKLWRRQASVGSRPTAPAQIDIDAVGRPFQSIVEVVPQPQADFAFGLRTAKWLPINSSV